MRKNNYIQGFGSQSQSDVIQKQLGAYQLNSAKTMTKLLTALVFRRTINKIRFGSYSAIEEIQIEYQKEESPGMRKNSSVFDSNAAEREEQAKIDRTKASLGKIMSQRIKSAKIKDETAPRNIQKMISVADQDLPFAEKADTSAFNNQTQYYRSTFLLHLFI